LYQKGWCNPCKVRKRYSTSSKRVVSSFYVNVRTPTAVWFSGLKS